MTSLISLITLTCLSPAGTGQDPEWWDKDWSHRREVAVSRSSRWVGAKGVAFAEIPTLGRARADGADFRVISPEGEPVPFQIISAGYDDLALIAFEGNPRDRVWVYFGNENADPSPHRTEFEAGLILEVRARADGWPKNWEAMQEILEKSTKVEGRWWATSVALGFNPLGSWSNGIYDFSGHLECPKSGEYVFAVNSIDACFLLIDDELVAQWPGWHGAGGGERGGHQGRVELEEGVHKIRFVNAFRRHGACTVGWKKPGDKRIAPISSSHFVGVFMGRCAQAETQDGPVPDFSWQFEDDLGLSSRPVTAVRFSPITVEKDLRWDFGDGVRSRERLPTHIYLENGTYTVTLRAGAETVSQKVKVRPRTGTRRGWGALLRKFASGVKDYPIEELSATASYQLALLCHEAQQFNPAIAGLRNAFEKGLKPGHDETQWCLRLFELYHDRGRYGDAVWTADWLRENTGDDNMKVAALALKGYVLLRDLAKVDEAEACFRDALEKYPTRRSDYLRAAYIGTGEVALVRGEKEEARKIFEEAERSKRWKQRFGDIDVEEGAHTIAFEECLGRGDHKAAEKEIDAWVWNCPTEMLHGRPDHLRGRVRLSQRNFADALRFFERAMKIDPEAPFADEALYWMAECHVGMRNPAKAKECWEEILENFPESKLVEKVREKLEEKK